jgi:hypothetical protein
MKDERFNLKWRNQNFYKQWKFLNEKDWFVWSFNLKIYTFLKKFSKISQIKNYKKSNKLKKIKVLWCYQTPKAKIKKIFKSI